MTSHDSLKDEANQRKPLNELMLEFESLGDNCEFGLVQRRAGAEPLGLLRFGTIVPNPTIGFRAENLVAALEAEFVGLGTLDTVTVELAGEVGRQEFMVRDTIYNVRYHSGVTEGQMEAAVVRQREAVRLTFLRRKFLDDLKAGEKISVWKSNLPMVEEQIRPLFNVLRRYGPNTLLWVVEAGAAHLPGTVEHIEDDLIKGYVERFAPYSNAHDIRYDPWFEVCQRTYDLCRVGNTKQNTPKSASAAPRLTMTGADEIDRLISLLTPTPHLNQNR